MSRTSVAAIVGAAAVGGMVGVLGVVPDPLATLLVIAFVLVGPGLPWVARAGVASRADEATLVGAVGVGMTVVVSEGLALLEAGDPRVVLAVLCVIAAVGLAVPPRRSTVEVALAPYLRARRHTRRRPDARRPSDTEDRRDR